MILLLLACMTPCERAYDAHQTCFANANDGLLFSATYVDDSCADGLDLGEELFVCLEDAYAACADDPDATHEDFFRAQGAASDCWDAWEAR